MPTNHALQILTNNMLAAVVGGGDPGYDPSTAMGRVGPGFGWKWLGNYYTPEALVHDKAVDDAMKRGDGWYMANAKALPTLPAAAGSYVRARFWPGKDDMHLPD
jgi:hypothetical protein